MSEAGRLTNNQQCPLLPYIRLQKKHFKRGWMRAKSVWKIWSTAFHSGLTLRLHFYARAAADMHFYITTGPLGLPASLGVVSFPSTLALESEFQEQVGWGNSLGSVSHPVLVWAHVGGVDAVSLPDIIVCTLAAYSRRLSFFWKEFVYMWICRRPFPSRDFCLQHHPTSSSINIAKGSTDPRVEFLWQDHSSQILNILQFQNLDQALTSKSASRLS